MTDSEASSSAPLQPEKVTAQVAALAAHLQRCGVQWLPKPSPESVEVLSDEFSQPASELAVSALPHSLPASPPASSKSTPALSVSDKQASDQPAPHRPARARGAGRSDSVAAFAFDEGPYPGQVVEVADRQMQLDALSAEVAACTQCEILSSCRKKTVFGEGSGSARVAFFGEGPGAEEDSSGRPFVGRAGQLLTKMIEACQFKREDVYILNTVKCRPPGNRNPEPEEISNCRHFYQQQFAIIRPEYIVCLGAVAAQELLKSKLPVGRLRGQLHSYYESKVLVTYHPAYLLRTPAAKKAAWDDLQLMLRDAGIEY